jgi:hypothetical protein
MTKQGSSYLITSIRIVTNCFPWVNLKSFTYLILLLIPGLLTLSHQKEFYPFLFNYIFPYHILYQRHTGC